MSDRVLWMNVRGTPRMSAKAVHEDTEKAMSLCSVLMLNEFRWDYYWGIAKRIAKREWASSPGFLRGYGDPIDGAQAVMWRKDLWKRVEVRRRLLHHAHPGITSDRYIRAVLLRNRKTSKEGWFVTTHFIPGGDRKDDPEERRALLKDDIAHLYTFLENLKDTGHPIIFQGDLNIHKGTVAYTLLRVCLHKLGARIVGEHGVEYTIVIPGRKTRVKVVRAWRLRTTKLNTDHEGRVMNFDLVDINAAA